MRREINEGHKRIYLVSFDMVFEQPYKQVREASTPVEENVLKFWYHLYESNLKYQV